MAWKWPWFGSGRRPERQPLRIRVYTRPGCHLCEEAWRLLEALQERYGFLLEAVNVDDSAELAQRYGEQVPVVLVNDKVRLWGRVNLFLLERLLRGESGAVE
jgi:glutaredoxin